MCRGAWRMHQLLLGSRDKGFRLSAAAVMVCITLFVAHKQRHCVGFQAYDHTLSCV